LLGRRPEPGHHLDPHGEVAVTLPECVPVLLREHRRRHEHQRLLAVQRHREGGPDRDLCLAEADIAADEPVHRPRRLEVLLDSLDRALLVFGLAVRETGLESLEPLVFELERLALGLLAPRIEGEQLAGQLAEAGAGAALQVLPRLAPELRERGRTAVGADVARHLPDLLVRYVEAVLAAERQQQVVAGDSGDLLRLEGLEAADTMVLVDDVVARPQVREALQRAPDRRRPAKPLSEDLRVRKQDEAELTPDEASPRRCDREE